MLSPRYLSLAAILLAASTVSARAVDEIQVYNAEIAKVGQWTPADRRLAQGRLRIHHQPDRRHGVWTKRRVRIRAGRSLRAQSRRKSSGRARVLHRSRTAAELLALQ